jgi:hypothetical protein
MLQEIISNEEAEIAHPNMLVLPKRQATRLRNQLALGLKGIALNLLGKSEPEAKTWVGNVFYMFKTAPELGLTYPDRVTNLRKFNAMFARPSE